MNEPTLTEIALYAKDLVADGWVRGHLYVWDENHMIIARCPRGAINEATLNYKSEHALKLEQLLCEVIDYPNISHWNDALYRTKQNVLDAFDEMARLAKERGL
jgi:hypothetical protein